MIEQQERRSHPRYRIEAPVTLLCEHRGTRFTGRGENMSQTGALVVLPLSVPVRQGQRVQVRLEPRFATTPTDEAPEPSVPRRAHVVRVRRDATLLDGLQQVGLAFDD